ncbi:MAG: acetolactate decarboxylase [Verrucomicrobiia bacterium]
MPLRLLLLALFLAGCATSPEGAITQVSTINALLAGGYDGQMRLAELRSHGDFGIGTFDRLDGEMILLDGRFHQAKVDGSVATPSPDLKTPYAVVTWFRPTATHTVAQPLDIAGIEKALLAMFPNPNAFCAVRARGHFVRVKVRSVPPQKKPYPLLIEASKGQAVFERRDVAGTLVGFRSPAWIHGISVPGAHFHFFSDDGRTAGHLLECALDRGTIEAQDGDRFTTILPRDKGDTPHLDLTADRSRDLQKVESDRR